MTALYIRLSSEDSKVGSFSIENQKRALHRYADEMGDDSEVVEFVDNGYTGTNFERPAVQELLELVRAGKIKCIIVKDFTRFGRNSIEVGYFMEMVFPVYGVRFISINDDFDSDRLHGDTGGINVAFKYLASEFYSRDLSIKYKSAKYVKFRCGEYQSKICPYGYQKSADGRMEPDPETAPNVRLIFDLAARGCNTTAIIQALFERKIPTPGEYKAAKNQCHYDISRCDGVWQRSSVLNILHDERYTGTYIIGKREVTEVGGSHVRLKDESQWIKISDHHPKLISKGQFEQAQARLRHSTSIKKKVHLYPLKCKVFCGCCKHGMQREGKKAFHFVCTHSKVDESAPCYDLDIAEAELEQMLYEIISKQAAVILNLDSIGNAGELDVQLAEQAEYANRIEAYSNEKLELYEGLVLNKLSLDEYKVQKAAIDKELGRLQELYSKLKMQTSQMQISKEDKKARLKLAQEVSAAGGLTAGLAETLIDRVYVYPGNQVKIIWKIKDFGMEEI
ncbi:MAG: recombinase family protein [Lachnospiraceae bacterium]|nr:recombinase family protein [Lachnospiraceae bacterium]